MIVRTIQLAVERYISEPQHHRHLPSRALVSLDIINMFNGILRERLREIIAQKFPSLEPFADMIYESANQTYVRIGWPVGYHPSRRGILAGLPFLVGLCRNCATRHHLLNLPRTGAMRKQPADP